MLRRDVVNVLNVQVPIPGDVSVDVVDNVTPVASLPDFDHTADWDDANATDDETANASLQICAYHRPEMDRCIVKDIG